MFQFEHFRCFGVNNIFFNLLLVQRLTIVGHCVSQIHTQIVSTISHKHKICGAFQTGSLILLLVRYHFLKDILKWNQRDVFQIILCDVQITHGIVKIKLVKFQTKWNHFWNGRGLFQNEAGDISKVPNTKIFTWRHSATAATFSTKEQTAKVCVKHSLGGIVGCATHPTSARYRGGIRKHNLRNIMRCGS